MESTAKLFLDSLKLKRLSSDLVPSHSLNWSRRTSLTESIVNLVSDSLKLKRSLSDLVPSHSLIGLEEHTIKSP
jgi:hypothetical protein